MITIDIFTTDKIDSLKRLHSDTGISHITRPDGLPVSAASAAQLREMSCLIRRKGELVMDNAYAHSAGLGISEQQKINSEM
jgi:hypothetical protein